PVAFALPSGSSFFLLWRAVRRLRLAPTPLTLLINKIPLIRTLRRDAAESAKMRAQGRQRRARRLASFYRIRNPLWLRSRLTRVYDREKYIGRIQWLAWFVALGFILLFAVCEPRALHEREGGMIFLTPVWLM